MLEPRSEMPSSGSEILGLGSEVPGSDVPGPRSDMLGSEGPGSEMPWSGSEMLG